MDEEREWGLPIETLDAAGVAQVIEWAEAEGWEPGMGDAGPFHAADPEGFFRSVEGGRTVAVISVVRGAERLAFVGLYIVAPGLRGRNHGRGLWDGVLSRFDGFTLGLDAVPEQVETYASDGFVPAYGNARYCGSGLPAPDASIAVAPAASVAFDDLVEFDGAHFFGPRPGFLSGWVDGEGRDAVVVEGEGGIAGFAASRRSSAGHRIGPVFADDQEVARALILSLAARAGGRVSIDVPAPNRDAVALVGSLGMERRFETTRMYRGTHPELPLDRIFGITSLELG